MKILLVHNYYRSGSPGGEDVVFEQERALLTAAGHEVYCYTRSNDEMDERSLADNWRVAWSMQRSRRTFLELRQLIKRLRPEVAHFHNIFPLISVSGYEACTAEAVPVVQTIHNYRFSCSAAVHFRNGSVCERCTPDNPWSSVRFACYRGSRAASMAVAAMIFRNHVMAIHQKHIAKFIALTKFAAHRLELAGIPRDRVVVKPNSIDTSVPADDIHSRGKEFLFVGRLSEEKGIRFLLEAWLNLRDVPLRVVGDGPLRHELEVFVHSHNLPIEFLGFLDRSALLPILRGGYSLVFPSLWFEGMPMTVLEAMAAGTPVIASRIGGMPEIIQDDVHGLLFDAGSTEQLQACVRRLQKDQRLQIELSRAARRRAHERYGHQTNLDSLSAIYSSVCRQKKIAACNDGPF
jgi:glycosyltransferase involved in cell wall biosynthesis